MPERYRVYWGADPWDGPRSLHEMLRDETDGEIGNDELRFVSDYRMNLVIPSEITDFHKFRTSVGTVLELLKYSKDKNWFRCISRKEIWKRMQCRLLIIFQILSLM